MAGRMSNRDRIENLRAEADAAAKEKEAAKAAKAAKASEPKAARKSSGKKAPAAAPRVRIVWMVCDAAGRDVKQFPYAQEQEARAEAAQLTTSTGKTHFVKQADVRVP
ncbi:MAG: hypothetical protein ACOVRP_04255, partial [Gemmatimonas sp.]|jgi:hypothetical protein